MAKIKEYTAVLNLNEVMDSHTLSPKVVLSDVKQDGKVFRDHVWVALDRRVKKFMNGNGLEYASVKIAFTAKAKKYRGSDGKTKKALYQLGNIKAL